MRKHFAGGSVFSASSQPLSSYMSSLIHEALCALLPDDALRSHGVLCLPDHVCKLSGALFVEEIRRICDRVLA